MKKLTIIIMAAAICLLSACGKNDLWNGFADAPANSGQENLKEPEVLQEEQSEESAEKDAEEADPYAEILAQYQAAVDADFYRELQQTEKYTELLGDVSIEMAMQIDADSLRVYYALEDIDQNGTQELVMAAAINGGEPHLYDIWGQSGGEPVRLFEYSFGYRTNLYLYQNGTLEVQMSSSAFDSGYEFYRLGADGITPELIAYFHATADVERDPEHLLFYDKEQQIPEEEYHRAIDAYHASGERELTWIEIIKK